MIPHTKAIPKKDNRIRKQFEANTKDTEVRIEALRKLREGGIKTSALICQVIPYITDVKPLINWLAPHTDAIWIYGLSIENTFIVRAHPQMANLPLAAETENMWLKSF